MPSHIDLHCHSTASDGTLAPAALVARAHAQGVQVLALTDHDTTAGLEEAAQAARAVGIHLVAGIELSAECHARSLHIVGLGIDPAAPELLALTAELAQLRAARAERMASSLAKAGIAGALAGAQRFAGEAAPTRTHFARYLVEQGVAPDVSAVFKRYLVRNRPGYASTEWPSLARTVQVIRAAGGIPVFAHPHSYGWTGAWSRRLLEAFIAAGGQGVEAACGNSTAEAVRTWAGYARRFGLVASVGSDFHAPGGFIELGRIPALPDDVRPVWQHLQLPDLATVAG
jgi:predicted metal-dependent phosphoesterase TrpH